MRTFGMAKKARGRPKGQRGPYVRDTEDPNQLGTGGIRLRQHRMARLWTVEQLADKADVSVGTVSGIENGEVGWSQVTLDKFARAFGVSIGELFDVDPREGQGRVFWPIWHKATHRQKERITDYAKGILEGEK